MQHRSTAWKEKSKILTTPVWFRLRILSLVVRQLLVSHRGGTLSSKDPVPFFRLSCSLLWRNQLVFRGNNPLCCLCPLRGQKPGCSHLAPPLLLCAKGQERCRSISCLCWPSEPPCWAEIMFPLEHMPGPHTSALPVQHLQQFWYQVTSCTFIHCGLLAVCSRWRSHLRHMPWADWALPLSFSPWDSRFGVC